MVEFVQKGEALPPIALWVAPQSHEALSQDAATKKQQRDTLDEHAPMFTVLR